MTACAVNDDPILSLPHTREVPAALRLDWFRGGTTGRGATERGVARVAVALRSSPVRPARRTSFSYMCRADCVMRRARNRA